MKDRFRFLDDYPLPEAFKAAWVDEFDYPPGSAMYLSQLLAWSRKHQGGINPGESARDMIRRAQRELDQWVLDALRADDMVARFHTLLRAVKTPHLTSKKIALRVYFEFVRSGRNDITKKALWDEVREFCKLLDMPAPNNRNRILAEIGLAGLPAGTRSGRPRKK
jgi:hypothetical protein